MIYKIRNRSLQRIEVLEEAEEVYVVHLDKLFSMKRKKMGGWCGRCGRAFIRSDKRTVEIQKTGPALLVHANDCLKKEGS